MQLTQQVHTAFQILKIESHCGICVQYYLWCCERLLGCCSCVSMGYKATRLPPGGASWLIKFNLFIIKVQ